MEVNFVARDIFMKYEPKSDRDYTRIRTHTITNLILFKFSKD